MAMRVEVFARWLSALADEPWAWVLPEGPYPLERRMGDLKSIGHAWYLWEGDTPAFRRSLRRSEAHVLRLLERPARRLPLDPSRRILLGFSQGGYFAGSLGLRHAQRFAGIAVAGARIRPAFAGRDLRGLRRLPILFLHGEEDDVIRLEDARASARELEDMGFPVTFRAVPGQHRWNGAMSEAFREWAGRIFGTVPGGPD
jgi:predicted esterase